MPLMIQPRSWQDIEDFYVDLTNQGWKHERFVELIQHIRATKLADRLFACTSMYKLLVSIYNPIELQRETLHLTFDIHEQLWHFCYYAVPMREAEFQRRYSAELGVEKFEQFISMIRW